jgi:hypothetical protein
MCKCYFYFLFSPMGFSICITANRFKINDVVTIGTAALHANYFDSSDLLRLG